MGIVVLSQASSRLAVGEEWLITVQVVSDSTGLPAADSTATAAVTDPVGNSTAPAVTSPVGGTHQLAVTVDSVGRWVASVASAGYGTANFSAEVYALVAEAGMPDVAEVVAYLGPAAASFTPDQITGALAAERAAQASSCDVPATYPADLREALLRRVIVNLARRQAGALAAPQGDAEITPSLPTFDPEVRRLETPYGPVLIA